jgi:hypothetical protein
VPISADQEARHHADARDQPAGHEGAAERDPEAEHLGDGRDESHLMYIKQRCAATC